MLCKERFLQHLNDAVDLLLSFLVFGRGEVLKYLLHAVLIRLRENRGALRKEVGLAWCIGPEGLRWALAKRVATLRLELHKLGIGAWDVAVDETFVRDDFLVGLLKGLHWIERWDNCGLWGMGGALCEDLSCRLLIPAWISPARFSSEALVIKEP